MPLRVLVLAVLVGCSANDDIPSPLISTITPDQAPAGAQVVVAGSYFCQRPGTSEDPTCTTSGDVHFGTVPSAPSQWTDTAIMVEVPQGVSGSVGVTVSGTGAGITDQSSTPLR